MKALTNTFMNFSFAFVNILSDWEKRKKESMVFSTYLCQTLTYFYNFCHESS